MTTQSTSATRGFDVIQLKNWLPVDVVIEGGRPGVQWLNMAGVVLEEPFLADTVARISEAKPNPETLFTEFDVLIELEKAIEGLQPNGFIFHSSRCGSTVLVNACRALRYSLVAAESPAIDKLITRFLTDIDPDGVKKLLYSAFLRGLIRATGQRRLGSERHYFVKFACTSALAISHIRRIWPTIPAIFLYRNPIEVMVSNLKLKPQWMMFKSNLVTAAAIIDVDKTELASMTEEEYCARALGRYLSAVPLDDSNLLPVDYGDLSPDALPPLIRFLGVAPSEEEVRAIQKGSAWHSKKPGHIFQPDDQAKKEAATSLIVEMAGKWALPAYFRLKSCSARVNTVLAG